MSEREWFRELPGQDDEDDPVRFIILEMEAAGGLGLEERAACLRRLLDDPALLRRQQRDPALLSRQLRGLVLLDSLLRDPARLRQWLRDLSHLHRLLLSDFLRRAEPEGSEWRPHRELERSQDPDEPATTHDYSEWVGEEGDGLPDWDEWWEEHWGKPVGNPGWFRERGRRVAKPPLVFVYKLVNRWWRRVLRSPFRPDFDRWSDYQRESARAGERGLSSNEAMAYLNPAARLLVLVAQAVDPRYTIDQCRRVHSEYYKTLDTSIK